MNRPMKRFLNGALASCILLVFFLPEQGRAQSDSVTVVHTKWTTKKLAPGIRLRHHWFKGNLFGSSQNINILEIRLNRRNHLDVEAEAQVRRPTSAFGAEHHALAAVNGTFFDMKNGGSEDYIRLDGKVLNGNKIPKNRKRALHQKAAIVIGGNKVGIIPWDGTEDWEDHLKGEDVMETGPLLLKDHRLTPLDTTSMYVARHPRTAVALRGKKVFLITVDGRNAKASGMSLYELAAFLKWMRADDAINLDGGGSTTLWIRDYAEGGIVNHPSDNRKMEHEKDYRPGMDLDNFPASEKWDRSGERPVANVLIVTRK
ncbi:MAG: phosphodiester glycosidase family protein [Flavisolibacter sp.]